jgi:predicted membrane protein
MDSIRKVSAILLAMLLALTMVLALILFNLEMTAFTPGLYQRVFANEKFYGRIPIVLGQALANSNPDSGLPASLQGLNAQDWETFLRTLLPPETLKVMGDQALASTFTYLNGEADSAVLSLVPLKAGMQSNDGVQAAIGLIQALPACTLEQIAQITMAVLIQQQVSLCNPPEQLLGMMTPLIQAQLQTASAIIPNEVVLASIQHPQNDPRQTLKMAKLLMKLSPLLPLGFLLLLTLVMVRSLREGLNWWGIPLLVSGAIAILISLTSAPAARLIIRSILEKKMPVYLPSILLDSGYLLAAAIVDELLKPVLWQGLAFAITGSSMILAGLFLKKKYQQKPAG